MTRRKRLRSLLIGLLMLSTGSATGAPPGSTTNQIIHVSIGIGDDDPIEIEMMRRLHNLQLVFALKGSGSYLAEVKVDIRNAAGEKVLTALSPGPLFFATLRPGAYRIDAEFRGKVLSRTASVTQGGRRDLYFYWDGE